MKKIMLYVLMFALTIASGFNSAIPAPQNPEVKIKEMSPFPYCSIQHKGPYSDMEQVITELMNLMQNQNIIRPDR